jgi:hypothetical protein
VFDAQLGYMDHDDRPALEDLGRWTPASAA